MHDSKQAKGGRARAAKLTQEERSNSARKAANERWHGATKATHYGEIHIGDSTIPCAVLKDGRRILTQAGFLKAIGRSKNFSKSQKNAAADMPAFLSSNNLKSFIHKELASPPTPILFTLPGGGRSYGYLAELLPKVAEVYLKARDASVLVKNQEPIAHACDILMRGLAHTGIVALVDEATGFQYERSRSALEKVLEKFIQEELGQWAKRFPDRFYTELFRLKNLDWPSDKNPPQYVGHWTNNLVYKRLAPGVLEELKRKSPKDAKGNRKNHLHQWLTDDIGHPKLREHIAALLALMKSSDTWEDFEPRLERALPKRDKEPTEEEAAQMCLIEV